MDYKLGSVALDLSSLQSGEESSPEATEISVPETLGALSFQVIQEAIQADSECALSTVSPLPSTSF